jgi:hypothetical protein
MLEQRTKRSTDRATALRYLIEAVANRSEVRAMALLTSAGDVLASVGTVDDVAGLATVAGPWVRGEQCPQFDRVTAGTDLLARAITHQGQTLYLAALGARVRKMPEAARSVVRILSTAAATA